MKLRASRTLLFSPGSPALVGFNFLTRQVFDCPYDVAAALSEWHDWRDAASLKTLFDPNEAVIDNLFAASALIERGSPLSELEDEFLSTWRWTLPAAMLHFSLLDPERMSSDEIEDHQRQRASEEPSPPLYLRNTEFPQTIRLPNALFGNPLLRLMARRRTVRTAAQPSITLRQLSDCLFAGLGITGETENCVGKLPLSMTPSGGARNPYEAYVYARNVEGLRPGLYHYSALDHDLGRVETNRLPPLSELVGGQEWADEMPCLIVLCAELARTMWKYDDANAYRVVLIEAGHIGQNIMLAATDHGLSSCPTAALSHSRIRECFRLSCITNTPVYALTLAAPGSEPANTVH